MLWTLWICVAGCEAFGMTGVSDSTLHGSQGPYQGTMRIMCGSGGCSVKLSVSMW